jgi:guanine deaminase
MTNRFDPAFLREAIRLSIEKMEADEEGAVVVRNVEIVGRGSNRGTSTNDRTAHAEVVAIRDACSRLETFSSAGCEIYGTCAVPPVLGRDLPVTAKSHLLHRDLR